MLKHIHFVTLGRNGSGMSFLTLPGQAFPHRTVHSAVTPGIIVKAEAGSDGAFRRLRSASAEGECFFTLTLRRTNGCYAAADMRPVSLLFLDEDLRGSDERLAWERYRIEELDWRVRDGISKDELIRALDNFIACYGDCLGEDLPEMGETGFISDDIDELLVEEIYRTLVRAACKKRGL